jgi:hypothetical protein
MENNIGSTLLTGITVTVLLPGNRLQPHRLLQPAGQAVNGHAGSTQLCTLSKHHLPSSIFHSCNLCLGTAKLLASQNYSIGLMVLPLFLTSPLHPLSNPLPVSPALHGGTLQLPGLCLTLQELMYLFFFTFVLSFFHAILAILAPPPPTERHLLSRM